MRKITNLNSDWYFLKDGTKKDKTPRRANKKWEQVNLPHTWNNMDGQDGGFDFYRGACWYFKTVKVELESDEEAYLEFQGVSSIATVFINGKKAGVHKGGFSTFRVNITPYLKRGKAKIAVMADNRENKEVYPQTADFTFFGGIYRDVNLITVNKSHFALDYCGGKGVSVTPKLCDDLKKADIEINTYITGKADTKVEFSLDGQTVTTDGDAVITLENPTLWDGIDNPYLYTLTCRLIKNGEAVDELTVDFGVRKFSVDSEKGFFLNNRPYPLRGVSRHQDRLDKGWAISKADHEEDIKLIREVGANTIRLAHYQHDDYFYTLCDRAGLLVWAEIPFISVFMPTKEAYDNTMSQMRELVIQAYNHPSIFTWGIANEITIGEETPELIKNLKDLNDLCHKLDKSRPTTMANVTMVPEDSQLNTITDILAYNHYFGWYMGCVDDNGPWLDNFHKNYPNICLGLSEYGCEGILAYHNDNPQMQDYSEEYQAYYHEKMLETFATRDYLWSTYVWNMFDFASDMRDEGGVKGRNNKGLVTFDRKIKKDSFFIYKAYWSEEKFVHLCSRRYVNRTSETTDIKVYSNCDEVTLIVNGEEFATVKGDKIFRFEGVVLKQGKNTVKAVSGDLTDEMELNLTDTPDESYVLKVSEGDNSGKNWFDTLDASGDLEFPDGYFSIKDKVGEIMKNPDGEAFINSMVEKITSELHMNISKGMMNMAKGFTVEKVFDMGGSRIPPEAKIWVNQQLNKIKK